MECEDLLFTLIAIQFITLHMRLRLGSSNSLLKLTRRRKTRHLLWQIYVGKVQNRSPKHAMVNKTIPILAIYFKRKNDAFKKHFRLNIVTFQELVKFLFSYEKCHGWTIEIELLVFIYWLACGCIYRVVGAAFQIPKSTVCRIVHKYLHIFSANIGKFVKLPKADELAEIGRGFCKLAKGNDCFSKAAGAIDGCHVRIAKVPESQATSYFNRKGFYSSNFQAVVNHEGLFIDVFIGYPGSVHDSRILRNSPLFYNQMYPPQGHYLLGDGGYPLLAQPIGMLIPFKEPLTTPVQKRFNALHSRARNIVERSFGRLKARWRAIFFKALECMYFRVPYVIAAAVCLQNFCINSNDIIEPEVEEIDDDEDDPAPAAIGDISGEQLRNSIASRASRPLGNLPPHLQNDHNY